MARYDLGIVNASLYSLETALMAKKYRESGSWETVKKAVLAENLFQKIHERTTRKIFAEALKRLKSAYPWEIDVLSESIDPDDWRFITLAFTARHYEILADVISEVIYHKWQGGDKILENYEIPAYVESCKAEHPELLELTDRSMADLLSTLKRNIKDGGLLEKDNGQAVKIVTPRIDSKLRQLYLEKGSVPDLKLLLIMNSGIKKLRS